MFTGLNRRYFAELDSTNRYALDVLSKTNPPEGTCVITDYQSGGRGQIGRYWHSASGKNLLTSYIFYPHFLQVNEQFFLNIISSLAVHAVVSQFCKNVKIKWPNDIYVSDQKIAGILVQNILRSTMIKSSVIGIGLNVNESNFPPHLPNPTSLTLFTKNSYDVKSISDALSQKLEYFYLLLKQCRFETLNDQYIAAMYRFEEVAQFRDAQGVFTGKIIGIDSQGKLIICTSHQVIRHFTFQEVQYVLEEELPIQQ